MADRGVKGEGSGVGEEEGVRDLSCGVERVAN